jgi:nucleoside-triphosphatase
MQKNILISGKPRSGKSTLLRKLIRDIPNKVGFVTNEILVSGQRVGFEMETHASHKNILAHVDFETPQKVSRYSVRVENLESVVAEVSDFKDTDLLYVDEIGQMELFSEKFKELVLRYLDSPNICVATISNVFENDFIKQIKQRDDIVLFEISTEDRDEKEIQVSESLKSLLKTRI